MPAPDERRRRHRPRAKTDPERWLDEQVGGAPPSLRVRDVAASALGSGLRYWQRVVTTTLVVFLLLGAIQAALAAAAGPHDELAKALTDLGGTLFDLLGVTFIAGFFCRTVGAAAHGLPEETAWEVLRAQPYGRLLLADLIVGLATSIGVVLLVLPGLAVLTLLALVGSAVKLEHRGAFAAIRRSVRVTRHHFWTITALFTIPFFVGSALASLLTDLVHGPGVAHFVVRLVTESAVTAVCGLTQTELGYRLLAAARIREAPTALPSRQAATGT